MAWTSSKSTEKLEVMEKIVCNIKSSLSEEKIAKIKTLVIGWKSLEATDGQMPCPTLNLEFFE